MSTRTNNDLLVLQHLSLDLKISMTKSRIRQWYNEFCGDVYVSFSGGKDSTVLLHLVREMYPEVPGVFVDTGLEYPEIREFVKTIDNITWLKPEMNFRKAIEKYGYPLISKEVSQKIYEARKTPHGACAARFDPNNEYATKYNGRYSMVKWTWLKDSDIPMSHMCCQVMKKRPAKKYEKQSGRKPFIATMACESSLRKTAWLKHGCNAFTAKRQVSQPMSFWTEQDVLEYLSKYEIPYASVYGDIVQDEFEKYKTTGCDRTGCVFCCFGCHNEKGVTRFQRLRETHPKLYEYSMKPWSEGGLGLKEIFDKINAYGKINIRY